ARRGDPERAARAGVRARGGQGGARGRMTTVVVPAHDEEAVIGRCLRTLLDGARPEEVRVVVVANGTSDRTLEVARAAAAEAGHEVETLDLPEPSKIAAVRAGMARADGAVVVLDADVQLPTATLRALARALDTDDPVV